MDTRWLRYLAFIFCAVFCMQTHAEKNKLAKKKPAVGFKVSKVAPAARTQVVLLRLYSRSGNHFQKNIFGLQVAADLIGVRLGSELTLQDVWIDNHPSLAFDGTVQVKVREADFTSRWLLFQTDRPLPMRGGVALAPIKLRDVFGETDLGLVAKGFLARRHIASMARSESEIVSAQLQINGERWAKNFESAKARLTVDRFQLSPMAVGMRCQSGQPRITNPELQRLVGSVQGLQCEFEHTFELSQGLQQNMQIQAGALGFSNPQMNASERWRLVHDLADSTMKGFAELSQDIAHSTAMNCDSAEIAESGSDVYFCTRGLRGFSDLNDSFLFLGRHSGGKYVYNLVRAAGLSSQATQRVFQHLIRTVEKSP